MNSLGLKRDDRGLRPSRLVAVLVGLIVMPATLGVAAASAGTAGSLFPRALELGLPINAAPSAEQNVSFPRSEQHAALVSVACTSAGNRVAVGDFLTEPAGDQEAYAEQCTSGPGQCVAAGTYVNGSAPETNAGMDDGNGAMVLGRRLSR
jgi:hypothetical protein